MFNAETLILHMKLYSYLYKLVFIIIKLQYSAFVDVNIVTLVSVSETVIHT
jgi:hypothetical protein